MGPAIGYALREQSWALPDDPAINAAEITFEQDAQPAPVDPGNGHANLDYVSLGAPNLSVTEREPPGRSYLEALDMAAREQGACSVSDFSGLPRGELRQTPHARPSGPRFSTTLSTTCHNISLLQSILGETRFYLDGMACRRRRNEPLSDDEFLAEVLQTTGCGWLLDVTGIYVSGLNNGYDPYEFIEQVMPAAEGVQLHLTGGYFDWDREQFVDSRAHSIPLPVLELYEFALEEGRDKVAAVFIERDVQPAAEQEWREEVQLVRDIAEAASALV